jgi:flagellar protein FliO/FliZ
MSIYFNAVVMLLVTIAAFVLLAKLMQVMRSRRLAWPWPIGGLAGPIAPPSRLAVEQTCMVDGKRRLLLVRCDEQRVLLLTGGPADLVVSVLPAPPAPAQPTAGAVA